MIVSSDRQSKPGDKIQHKPYQVPFKPGYIEETLIRPALEGNKHQIGLNAIQLHLAMCECLLNSTELLHELKDFDLIVYDSNAPCAVLVSQFLKIPTVIIAIAPPNHVFSMYQMIPKPLSYISLGELGFPSDMTFLQRVINVVVHCLQQVLMEIVFVRPLEALKVKYNINHERSFKEGFGDAELVIFLADFAMEYPQPLLPGWFSSVAFSFLFSLTL